MKKLLKYIILKCKNKNCKIYSKDISFNIKLEEKVRIYKDVYIDKNVNIGKYSYISSGTKIYCNTKIGAFCSIGPNVTIGPGNHDYNLFTTHPILYDRSWNKNILENNSINKKTIIGNDVWIGCNALILNGIMIGDGAVIGAGTIVTKDIPPYAIVIGNPGKIIKYRFNKGVINKLISEKWWEKELNEILKYDL